MYPNSQRPPNGIEVRRDEESKDVSQYMKYQDPFKFISLTKKTMMTENFNTYSMMVAPRHH